MDWGFVKIFEFPGEKLIKKLSEKPLIRKELQFLPPLKDHLFVSLRYFGRYYYGFLCVLTFYPVIMFVALIGLIQDGTIAPQDRAYFLQMRNDEEKYILFCDEILSCVVGRHQWCQLSWQQPISELTTISDEAFAHLLVENSWDVWTDKAFDPEDTTDSSNCGE